MDGKGNGHSLSLPISHAVGVGPALHCASSAVLHWAHSSEWEHPSTRGDVGNIPPSRSHAGGVGPTLHCASSAELPLAHASGVGTGRRDVSDRSEENTSELQSPSELVCRL